MKIPIVHLSDIHLTSYSDLATARTEMINAAIRAESPLADVAFIVVSGDLAYSGQPEQYESAVSLISEIRQSIGNANSLPVYCVVVPGNHDCNFERDSQLRRTLVSNLVANAGAVDGSDTSIVDALLEVQADFFASMPRLTHDAAVPTGYERLRYRRSFTIKETTVSFECYNTAWGSQLKERQGQLAFPICLLTETAPPSDVVVSVFHHPYNWLQHDNARVFRRHVERTSDLILTGHEHDSNVYAKSLSTGERPIYVEGSVLQSEQDDVSGFNIVVMDLDKKEWRSVQYVWNKASSMYQPRPRSVSHAFERSKNLVTDQFQNTESFADYLHDAGAAFTHPKLQVVKLRDIFVYPNVEDLSDGKSPEQIPGDRLLDYVVRNSKVLFIGQDRSGRTALAKMLYIALHQRRQVPLLLSGSSIRQAGAEAFQQLIDTEVTVQYGADLQERYRQLSPAFRVLIIDDFNKTTLNRKGRNALLDLAIKIFDRVILFADTLFQVRELGQKDSERAMLFEFRRCQIKPFGHARRSQVIERWYRLGQEYTLEDETVIASVDRAERVINTVLGRNLLPPYPIFVLTVLQSLESHTSLNTAAGSYGYIYELLITAALTRVKGSTTLDTKYSYIATLAHHLFTNDKSAISDDDLPGLNEKFYSTYRIRIAQHEMMRELQQSLVLLRVGDGYRFRYKYLYYYFVAKYLQDNLSDSGDGPGIRETLRTLTRQLHNEDSANILIFFIYLTKDPDVIREMLANAKRIFQEYEACDMESHVRFIAQAAIEEPRLEYYETDVAENRLKYRARLDEAEALQDKPDGENREGEVDVKVNLEQKLLDDLLNVNTAVKTVQIMGQILRNFPGSLRGDVKLEIARESYLLEFRALRVILKILAQGLPDFTDAFISFEKEEAQKRDDRVPVDEIALRERADQFGYWIAIAILYSGVKWLASSVGSDQLRETYKEIMAEQSSPAFSLVDIAIKLDHFKPIPQGEIFALFKKLRGNTVGLTLLRRLVLDYLYLYPTDYDDRQRLCQKLEIRMQPKMLEPGSS